MTFLLVYCALRDVQHNNRHKPKINFTNNRTQDFCKVFLQCIPNVYTFSHMKTSTSRQDIMHKQCGKNICMSVVT